MGCKGSKYVDLLNNYYRDNFISVDKLKEFIFLQFIETQTGSYNIRATTAHIKNSWTGGVLKFCALL
jgi:hypothetical protein